jgi:hypothetical protein
LNIVTGRVSLSISEYQMMLIFIAINGNPGGLREFQQLTADGFGVLPEES